MVVSGEFRTVSAIENNLRLKGNLFHEVFQNIKTTSDIEMAATELVKKGKIQAGELNSLILEVKNLTNKPAVKNWFSSEWDVKNEADILLKSGQLNRPDRIMFGKNRIIVVDYKFGERAEDAHSRQIMNYKNKLHQMGYKNIEAYLWYVFLNKVIPVTEKPVQGKLFD